jgi:type IV pilus assembly protein PilN
VIRINLLPHREERRKALRQQFYALSALVATLALFIWFVGYSLIEAMSEHQAEKNRFLKGEIAVLDKQIEEIKKLKEQTESLLQRKQVIESLQANRTEIVHLFNELAHRLPAGVYLKSIKQEGQQITLVGYAQSNARVSTLMHNLDESPILERPVLIEIKAAQVAKRRMSEFSMNIFFARQSSAEQPAAAAKKPGAGK